jgi:hypothetical protein
MDGIFQKIKRYASIAEIVEQFGGLKLDRHDKRRCPFHDDNTASFSVNRDEGYAHCFGCGWHGDAADFVAKLKGIEPLEAARLIAEYSGIRETSPKSETPPKPEIKPTTGITEYIDRCASEVGKTEYWHSRGFTDATIERFNLGYDARLKVAVIPYGRNKAYYQTRSTEEKAFKKPPTAQAGEEPLFNFLALSGKDVVYVVESPICAISIAQCGGTAISICGASGHNKLFKALKDKPTDCVLALCMDNDEAGKRATETITAGLDAMSVNYVIENIAGDCKDPNELLMKDPEKLAENVRAATERAKAKTEIKGYISAAELQRMHVEPPTWLVSDLLTDGLAMLIAPPKSGKSFLVFELCLAIALGMSFLGYATTQAGCYYLALEDSYYWLKFRMTKMLKNGQAPDNLFIALNADPLGSGLLEQVKKVLTEQPGIKLVVIDILQMVRGAPLKNELMYAYDVREMKQLKAFANKNKICVLLVHHMRKMKDVEDAFNQASGSTGLFGTVDCGFALVRNPNAEREATLMTKGRNIERREIVIKQDVETLKWEAVGDADEIESDGETKEYENDPIMKTIKTLVDEWGAKGWEGTTSELMKKVIEVTGTLYHESNESVGRKLTKFEIRLYADGIKFEKKRDGRGVKYFFSRRSYAPYSYQMTIPDDE